MTLRIAEVEHLIQLCGDHSCTTPMVRATIWTQYEELLMEMDSVYGDHAAYWRVIDKPPSTYEAGLPNAESSGMRLLERLLRRLEYADEHVMMRVNGVWR